MLLSTLAKDMNYNYNMFIVQVTVVTIVNYDCNTFIVQAIEGVAFYLQACTVKFLPR